MREVKQIVGDQFNDFISLPKESDEIAVVQFSATWCGPCKVLTSALNKELEELEASGKIIIAKVDVEVDNELSNKLGIRSLPTVLFFRNGRIIHEIRKGVTLGSLKQAVLQLTTEAEDEF